MILRVLAGGVALLVAACAGANPTAPSATPTHHTLTVYAAASLRNALDAVKAAYEAAHADVMLVISTDSSTALEIQIEQGAPADIFLSADVTNPAKLAASGFAAGDPMDFAGNALVVIVAPGDPAGITSPFDLARPGVKVIAAGDDVPISTYATKLVRKLAIAPGAPMGFERSYARNIVSKEDNVKAVVAKVALGEGDAAIVYATDARSSPETPMIEVTPASANVRATYAGVIVKASRNQAEATSFLAWLAGPDGQRVLASFGFVPPS